MVDQIVDVDQENDIGVLLTQNNYYQKIIFACVLVYPCWSLFYAGVNKGYVDPFIERVLLSAPLLIFNLLSYKFNVIYKNLKKIFYFFIIITILHFHYLLFQNNLSLDYIIGGLLVLFCIVNFVIDPNFKIFFSGLYLFCSIGLSIGMRGYRFLYPDQESSILILGTSTVFAFTFLTLYYYRKIQSALQTEIQENTNLRRWSSVGQMAGGIAHEVNSPLTAMMLTLDMLEEKISAQNISECKKDISALKNMGIKIGTIIKSLRLLTTTGGRFDKNQVHIFNLIDKTISEFKLGATSQIKVKTRYNVKSDGFTIGNEQALQQVFINITKNAIEAIAGLEERWVQFSVDELKLDYRICIQDSGKNFPETLIEKIFDPFYTTKDVGKGMGIGLSICKTIILAHGGTIRVNPNFKNTTFEIVLPKSKRKVSSNAA